MMGQATRTDPKLVVCVQMGETVDNAIIGRHMRTMPAEKLAEFCTFSGKFHACLVCE